MKKPVNEMGVVALFSQYCQSMGYVIMEIQAAFPDATVYHIETGTLLRVEFEYRARNFVTHGHDPQGCDLIVCWENNWPDCPVPVIEMTRYHDGIEPAERVEDLAMTVHTKQGEFDNLQHNLADLELLRKNTKKIKYEAGNLKNQGGKYLLADEGNWEVLTMFKCGGCKKRIHPIVKFDGRLRMLSTDRLFVISKATIKCQCGHISTFDERSWTKSTGIGRVVLDRRP